MPTPTATILSPLEGDTIAQNNAVVTAACSGFDGVQVLTCAIGGQTGTATPLASDGAVNDNINGMVPLGLQSATAAAGGNPLDEQDNVNVVTDQAPIPVALDPPSITARHREKSLPSVSGSTPANSNAAYVVCQVIEVNAGTGTRNIVAAGAVSVDAAKKWKITFNAPVPIKPDASFLYVARAFAYTKGQFLLGAQTVLVKKQ
jgi:hypothetical protein